MRRFAVVTAIVMCAVLVAAQPVAASWIQQTTPNPSGTTDSQFGGVSCISSSTCTAVGNFSDSSGRHILAEVRNGSTWTIQSTVDPPGSTDRQLSGVSCTSTNACIAVGSFASGGATLTLAEAWNGSSWTMQSTPNPFGATSSQLSRVSCASANACIAVGLTSGGGGDLLLAEVWNGSSWAIQNVPIPAGASSSQLTGVWCTSANACIAVGSSTNGSNVTTTLAEAWNGANWTIQSTPNPTGTTFSPLNAVSCTAANACEAVGRGLAEKWNGTIWTLQKIGRPQGNTPADLTGVSCTSAAACVGVGGFYDSGAILTLVLEAWNGTRWIVQNTPISTANDSSLLDDVSCTSVVACTSVGSYHDPVNGNRLLAEGFTLIWQEQPPTTPSGAIASSFDGVSCPSANACMAVGGYETSGSVFDTLAEFWNGSGWTIESTPNPTASNLDAVSCTSAKACTAVGDVLTGGISTVPQAERWNGSSWTIQSVPNPTGGFRSFLTGVSCVSATACTAVGFSVNNAGTQVTLAATWNGTTWTLQSTPNPAGTTTSQLNGVSCASLTACIAVGYYVSSPSQALVEAWNGTKWTIQSTPSLTDGYLAGVSCTSATACTATGDYFNGAHTVTVAERWNGTSWTTQSTPAIGGGGNSFLRGVSCSTASSCTAVGEYSNGAGTFFTLSEHWNGINWQRQMMPDPTGAQGSDPTSVSCPSVLACMAVGWFTDSTGTETLLAEQFS